MSTKNAYENYCIIYVQNKIYLLIINWTEK